MPGFFTRERFGSPQIIAGSLLFALIAQCFWLIARERSSQVAISRNPISEEEMSRFQQGIEQWRGHGIAGTSSAVDSADGGRFDPIHSPLWYLIASAPGAALHIASDSRLWLWFTRAPYVLFAVQLGASLWYVARRLYGNSGGYIALSLYCFSPSVIRSGALWFSQPNMAGAWGAFGAVFTAIAVSHTLYAPREVVLWNWRRILLLGVSLALAVGSDFRVVVLLPVILLFMLYIAPERRAAACIIFLAANAVALLLLFAAYFFHPQLFWQGLSQAAFLDVSLPAFRMPGAYLQIVQEVAASGPVLALLGPAVLIAFAISPRSRYFGNIAPLLVATLFLGLRVASPHEPDSIFTLIGIVFLFLLIAGIGADLLETQAHELVAAIVIGLLAANALWNLFALGRIST